MAWTLYRTIEGREPTLIDFMSRAARGESSTSIDPDVLRLWDGISCWATETQARRMARRYPNQGSYIAVLHIPDDASVRVERTRGPGHHTVWGDPAQLITYVVAVAPV